MSLKEEIVELLRKGPMVLPQIYAHFPERSKPCIRGILNKGVKKGTFVRVGNGMYAVHAVEKKGKSAEKGKEKEKAERNSESSEHSNSKTKRKPPRTPREENKKEAGVELSVRLKSKQNYIQAAIRGLEKFAGCEDANARAKARKKKQTWKKKQDFAQVKDSLLKKGYVSEKHSLLKVEEILLNKEHTAGVGELLEGIVTPEFRLPDELIEKPPHRGILLKHPENDRYWKLDLLRKTLRDAGIPFKKKIREKLRFAVDCNTNNYCILYAFGEEWGFAAVVAEHIGDDSLSCDLVRV